jgi:hypothetical protein
VLCRHLTPFRQLTKSIDTDLRIVVSDNNLVVVVAVMTPFVIQFQYPMLSPFVFPFAEVCSRLSRIGVESRTPLLKGLGRMAGDSRPTRLLVYRVHLSLPAIPFVSVRNSLTGNSWVRPSHPLRQSNTHGKQAVLSKVTPSFAENRDGDVNSMGFSKPGFVMLSLSKDPRRIAGHHLRSVCYRIHLTLSAIVTSSTTTDHLNQML